MNGIREARKKKQEEKNEVRKMYIPKICTFMWGDSEHLLKVVAVTFKGPPTSTSCSVLSSSCPALPHSRHPFVPLWLLGCPPLFLP
jgi:hypothetical protein